MALSARPHGRKPYSRENYPRNHRPFNNPWADQTSDKEILSDIMGMRIECDDIPCQHKVFQPMRTKQEDQLIGEKVAKLVNKQVIPQDEPQPDQILSGIFLHPKKDGSYRLILHLKQFNTFETYHHLKMDSLNTITNLVVKNCFMATIYLKDAYYSIPIHSGDRKFLRFEWSGLTFEFTCLLNGLSCCPRKFTKILKPILAYLYINVATFQSVTLTTYISKARHMTSV